jgi:sarcosine oxidase, subunit gamma
MIKKEKVKMPDFKNNFDELNYKGAIKVNLSKAMGMISLKGDLADKSFIKIITENLNLPLPNTRNVSTSNNISIIWMAPDELLLLVDYDQVDQYVKSLEKNLDGLHYLLANVSDARVIFNLKGKGVCEVLAKGTPADMSVFEVNDVRRSRIGQLAVAFWMIKDDEIKLICFRSVSDYMFDWLKVASAPNSLPGYFE